MARGEQLLGKMDAACAQLEAWAEARALAEQAEYERKVAARAERAGSAKGPAPKPPRDTRPISAPMILFHTSATAPVAPARLQRKTSQFSPTGS